VYGRNLDEDIADDVGSHLGRLLRSLASAGRAEGGLVDANLAKTEAEELYKVFLLFN
jgi:hypothetical protein